MSLNVKKSKAIVNQKPYFQGFNHYYEYASRIKSEAKLTHLNNQRHYSLHTKLKNDSRAPTIAPCSPHQTILQHQCLLRGILGDPTFYLCNVSLAINRNQITIYLKVCFFQQASILCSSPLCLWRSSTLLCLLFLLHFNFFLPLLLLYILWLSCFFCGFF